MNGESKSMDTRAATPMNQEYFQHSALFTGGYHIGRAWRTMGLGTKIQLIETSNPCILQADSQ